MQYAQVVLGLPINKSFSYRIPEMLQKDAEVGKRVRVSFGKRDLVGYIVGLSEESEARDMKSIQHIIDKEPIVSPEMLKLTKWVSDYYLCSWGEAIESTIPGVLRKGKVSILPRKPVEEKEYEPTNRLSPTSEQKAALEAIRKSLSKREHKTFLLHGITASGKTEVYLQAINFALEESLSSIVLVPEISLTPQTVERFKSRFGDKVAVVHSRLMGSARFMEWQRIRTGQARIVVGARSAVFSPVKDLGLIIVDEEHEGSYKQEDAPRYHARDVAVKRTEIANAVLVLGSATPSLESFYNAQAGKFKLIRLTRRVEEKKMPEVKIVDMRRELIEKRHQPVFSRILKDALEKALAEKGQAILFLNRRGFSTSVVCSKCGLVVKCKRCDSVMVYHFSEQKMICHHCNYKQNMPDICPKCRAGYMRSLGLGTERVESELNRYFPERDIERMDTDATKKRGSHDRILGTFKKRDIDVLVGTQMIAKGLDFPTVTLVGVISADTTLNLPDFRASERTFNLLTQVAGRAGRGSHKGLVIVQTYSPGHYAITSASEHDYESFYKQEIHYRKDLNLPPFVHMTRLTLRSRNNQRASEAAANLVKLLRKKFPKLIKIIGPAPAMIPKLRGQYRWNILLKTKNPEEINSSLRSTLEGFKKPFGVFIAVDVDPISV